MAEVEEICDRVAILCRGKLVALDSPLALRSRHTEQKVDAMLTDGSRVVFDLTSPAERERLAAYVSRGDVTTLKTREFDFHETFLKLTGTIFG
jgi:ABC-2 type transport system ATP-binding protein